MVAERFPVEAGQIMLFARAIGDFNPIYHDETHATGTPVGGVIAPPTFVQASYQYDPDCRVRPKADEPWFGSGGTPSGMPGTGGGDGILHAEQHYEYFEPLRPGDQLDVTVSDGGSWTKEGRSGPLAFSETITEFRTSTGALAVRARSVIVKTSTGS